MNANVVVVAMLPEHFLLVGVIALILLEIASSRSRGTFAVSLFALIGAAVAAVSLASGDYAAAPFPGQFSVDSNDLLAKAIIISLAVPVLLLSRDDFTGGRFHVLLLSSLYVACLLLSAD